jgi:hypothetical protein
MLAEENQALAMQAMATLIEMQMLAASAPLQTPLWNLSRDPATGTFLLFNSTTGLLTCVSPNACFISTHETAACAATGAGGRLAGGSGGSHHLEKAVVKVSDSRLRLKVSVQDFKHEVEQQLQTYGEIFTWNAKKKTMEDFKASAMWSSWVAAGHNKHRLVRFINHLKAKHLEEACKKDTGEGVAKFESEVVKLLSLWCGDASKWNFKKRTLQNFRKAPFWTEVKSTTHASKGLKSPTNVFRNLLRAQWTAAGHSEQKLVNTINRLRATTQKKTPRAPQGRRGAKSGTPHLLPLKEHAFSCRH